MPTDKIQSACLNITAPLHAKFVELARRLDKTDSLRRYKLRKTTLGEAAAYAVDAGLEKAQLGGKPVAKVVPVDGKTKLTKK